MADIFISYASEDRARAEQLVRALGARCGSLWWDRELCRRMERVRREEARRVHLEGLAWKRSVKTP